MITLPFKYYLLFLSRILAGDKRSMTEIKNFISFRMSNLKDIFGEVETILVENQEKRESIRDAAKELEAKVIASMQVSRSLVQTVLLTLYPIDPCP